MREFKMSATPEQLIQLAKKFPEQDIEWRVQQAAPDGKWAMIIPYITNRAIMQRLDDAVGMGNWKNEITASPDSKGYMCGISIKIDGEWVTRWDGSSITGTTIDPVKSTISAAMKRTGVQWGIGRYLYQFDAVWADCKPCSSRREQIDGYNFQKNKNNQGGFQWKPKPLPKWALPVTQQDIQSYYNAMTSSSNEQELKVAFSAAYKLSVAEGDKELEKKFIAAKDNHKQVLFELAEEEKDERLNRLTYVFGNASQVVNSMSNEASLLSQVDRMKQEIIAATNGTKEEWQPFIDKLDVEIKARLELFKG